MLDRLTGRQEREYEEYFPVRVSILVRLGFFSFDLYMKLADDKFVKFAHGESEFTPADAQKLIQKNIIHLYLRRKDAEKMIRDFQQNIAAVGDDDGLDADEILNISQDAYEMTHNLARTFGWTEEVQRIAVKSVNLALKAISKNPKLLQVLQNFFHRQDSFVAAHSHILSFLCCGVAKTMDWTSDYTYLKLSMASLLHDIVLTREQERNYRSLSSRASDPENKDPDVVAFRAHPQLAYEVVLKLKDLPPDIDKIVLQHHESPDGRGFPSGLVVSRINPLSALFIVCHDLVIYLSDKADLRKEVRAFVKKRADFYKSGHFKKVLNALTASLEP